MKFNIGKNSAKNVVVVEFKDVKNTKFEVEKNFEKLILKLEKNELDLRSKIGSIRNIIREARKYEIQNLEINFDSLTPFLNFENLEENVEFVVTNFMMANYEFDTYKKKNEYKGVVAVDFTGIKKEDEKIFTRAIENGVIIALGVNGAREVSNAPANIINPGALAQHVKEIFKSDKSVKVTILNQKELEKMKAGGILAVAAGSIHEPKLIVMEYNGTDKKQKPLCFIGKGVTHDNGGINLKPSSGGSLEEMHLDMSGASAVIHAFYVLSKMKVKKNFVAIVPAVENSISGLAYRPGDIITSLSGKTIEVLNTDAEGRIILADALTYAQENYEPELIIDVATLTGAALVALGTAASPVMSNDDEVAKLLQDIGNNQTGDFLWQFPIWDEYKKAVKNKRADIGNIPESNSRLGGSINGAMFLKEFINEKQKWAHIDMAPRMTSTASDNLAPGAMGETVRLLVSLGRN